jgi:hypothetical protein
MLSDDLAALQALAASGAISPAELAAARKRVINAFIAAPVAPAGPSVPAAGANMPAAGAPTVVTGPTPARVPGIPRYFGKIPPRMVPVALATGAGVLGGMAAGEAFDAVSGPDTTAGNEGGVDPGSLV